MIKQFLQFTLSALLGFGLVIGCGATAEDDSADQIGSVEQDMTAPSSPTLGYGVTTGASHAACPKDASGIACLIPTSKTLHWCGLSDSGGLTAAELADAQTAANAAQANTSFALIHVADGAACNTALQNGTAQIGINHIACSGVCNSTASIDGCVCVAPSQGSPLTESLLGSYTGMNGGIIHLDRADMDDPTHWTASTEPGVRQHAFGHAFAALLGNGNITNFSCSGSSPLNSKCTTPTSFSTHNFYTAGALCKMQHFNEVNPTTFAYSGTCTSD